MIDFYGRDFVDQMLASKSETLKLYKRDYEEMLSDWNAQIKEHLHRVGHSQGYANWMNKIMCNANTKNCRSSR